MFTSTFGSLDGLPRLLTPLDFGSLYGSFHNSIRYLVPFLHTKADAKQVNRGIFTLVSLTGEPGNVIVIVGDFSRCRLTITWFYQSVTVPTREDSTVDLVYCNVKDAFLSVQRPCVGNKSQGCAATTKIEIET